VPADGPADPWFRPVWEDGDDDPPSPDGHPYARLLKLPGRRASLQVAADPLRIASPSPWVARRIAAAWSRRRRTILPGAITPFIARTWLFLRRAGSMFRECSMSLALVLVSPGELGQLTEPLTGSAELVEGERQRYWPHGGASQR
jgi:hypothetical protein